MAKTSKKILSVFLSLLMIISMCSVMGLSVFAEDEPMLEDTISDEMSARHIEHETAFTFTEGTVPAGSYYLADDTALTGDLTITGEVHLCLNGKVLNINGEHKITVTGADASLNIYDCQDTVHKFSDSEDSTYWVFNEEDGDKEVTGGVITGIKSTSSYSGSIYIKNEAQLNIFKGNFVANYAYFNSTRVILVENAKINIYSAKIYGNCFGGEKYSTYLIVCNESECFLGKNVDFRYNYCYENSSSTSSLIGLWNSTIGCCYSTLTDNNIEIMFYVHSSTATLNGTIADNTTTYATIYLNNNATLNLNGVVSGNEIGTRTIYVNKGSTLNILENAVVENNTITDTEDSDSTTGILLRNNGEGYTNRIVFQEVPTSGTPIEIRFEDGCENTTVELGEGVAADDIIDKIVTYDETKYELDIIDGEIVYVKHIHEEETVPQLNPTCTENGWTAYTVCSKCGLVLDGGGHEILATGHPTESYVANVNYKPATCTEDGYTGDLVCGICHEVITAGEVVSAVGHRYSELMNVVEATCYSEGYTGDVYCTICNKIVIAGHTVPVVTVGDVHTDANPKNHICDDCGATISHCEDADENHFCDYCGKQLSDHYDRTSDHFCDLCGDRVSYCDDTDDSHFCDLCGERVSYCVDEIINATGEAGHDHYCDLCNTKTSSHNFVKTDTFAATCTEGAYFIHTCTICGETHESAKGEALGHKFNVVELTAPTCTEEGVVTRTCSVCQYSETDTEPATGHHHTGTVVAPTCTEKGYTVYTCECGDSYNSDYVAARGHRDANGDSICDDCALVIEKAPFRCSLCDIAEQNADTVFGFIIVIIHTIVHFFSALFAK